MSTRYVACRLQLAESRSRRSMRVKCRLAVGRKDRAMCTMRLVAPGSSNQLFNELLKD